MPEKIYSDLHCHPHARIFHWKPKIESQGEASKYHPWTFQHGNLNQQEKGGRAFSYSQCDPAKLLKSNTRLVFPALYPIEKGFFSPGDDRGTARTVEQTLKVIQKAFLSGFKIRKNAQSVQMRIPVERLSYFLSGRYDYYKALKEEREFLLQHSGKRMKPNLFIPKSKGILSVRELFRNENEIRQDYEPLLSQEGTYRVCKDFDEVQNSLSNGEIAMVYTIEGMHALGTDTHLHEVMNRIDEIKKWDPPVFFVTFAHHFNNYLCGHAHSIIKIAEVIFDQETGMDDPFFEEGKEAIKRLLSLDSSFQYDKNQGRRILPDLKHMAAKSRKWYYDEIISKAKDPNTGEYQVPVILSHMGYSGQKSINAMIRDADKKKESDNFSINGFYAWNINLSDDDIYWVVKTKGIIGLCLDQRILGFVGKDRRNNIPEDETSIRTVTKNIYGIIHAIRDHAGLSSEEKADAWKYITIGTDFEGYIDPVNKYSTSLDFPQLEEDLIKEFRKKRDLNNNPERAARMVMFDNVFEFLKRNFKAQ